MKDMTFTDRRIVSLTGTTFGIVLTQKEAEALANHGFNVKSKTLEMGEDPTLYLVVWVNSSKMKEGFNLLRLEMEEPIDVVIHPSEWNVGGKRGVKSEVVATWSKAESPITKIRNAIAGERAVQAGWAFGVPEDGREQWLDLVVAAVMRAYS